MPSKETLDRFVARVESNAHVEAVEEFYTEHSSVRENQAVPRVGREAHVANERRFLSRLKSLSSKCIRPIFVNQDFVVIGGTSVSSCTTARSSPWMSCRISVGRGSA